MFVKVLSVDLFCSYRCPYADPVWVAIVFSCVVLSVLIVLMPMGCYFMRTSSAGKEDAPIVPS